MPSEPRIRARLDAATSRLEPDIDRHLHQALASGRRRVVYRRIFGGVAVTAVLALAVILVPRLVDTRSLPQPAGTPTGGSPSTSPSPILDLVGTWTATVIPTDVRRELADAGLAQWDQQLIQGTAQAGKHYRAGFPQTLTLRLRPDGRYLLQAATGVIVDRGTYLIAGSELRLVQAWPNGVTIYRVEVQGDVMSLVFESDSAQPFPPSIAPHEAFTRALYASVAYGRE
jgi:hypothetical protein